MLSLMSTEAATDRNRRGVVLLIVIVTLLMISATAAGLVSLAQSEYRVTKLREREIVLNQLLDSGETYLWELAKAPAEQRRVLGNPAFNPDLLRPIALHSGDPQQPRFRMLPTEDPLVQGLENLPSGWTDESGKLNLWTLREWESKYPGQALASLLEIPRVTPELAGDILAAIGIESYGISQNSPDLNPVSVAFGMNKPPFGPVGRLTCLEDLVVRTGSAAELWFYPNRWKSKDRSNAETALPPNQLNLWTYPPLSEFLTLFSLEKNQTAGGRDRIYLNQSNLRNLHAAVSDRLGKELADFIVLYRQFGPSATTAALDTISDVSLDFNLAGSVGFLSELDLINSQVIQRLPSGRQVRLISPLSSIATRGPDRLQAVLDQLTVEPRTIIPGRINILTAPREVLLAIPEMDYMLADQILVARQTASSLGSGLYHPSWILEQELVDLPRAKRLVGLMTCSGNVLQARVEAFFPQTGQPISRVVVVDGTDPRQGRIYARETQ
jgi:hypothetical protein